MPEDTQNDLLFFIFPLHGSDFAKSFLFVFFRCFRLFSERFPFSIYFINFGQSGRSAIRSYEICDEIRAHMTACHLFSTAELASSVL